MRSLRCILRHTDHALLQGDGCLRYQRAVERLLHVVPDTKCLLLNTEPVGGCLLPVHVAPQAELAAEHDLLLHVGAFFTAAVGAAAYVIATVADQRIRREPCLPTLLLRTANRTLRFSKRKVGAHRHRKKIFNAHRGPLRYFA